VEEHATGVDPLKGDGDEFVERPAGGCE
jgi:hypothetical protein